MLERAQYSIKDPAGPQACSEPGWAICYNTPNPTDLALAATHLALAGLARFRFG